MDSPPTDEAGEAGAVLGMHGGDEGDVLNLVGDVLAGVAGDGGLELARQVVELAAVQVLLLDLADGGGGVDDLLGGHAGHGRAEDDARDVAAAHHRRQADALELLPDRGDVLDLDPVQLDVLPVGEVGGRAGVVARDLADGAQLLRAGQTAVEAHAHHEVAVLHLGVLQLARVLAAEVLAALGVDAEPLEAWGDVLRVNGVEALFGVDVDDALAHGEGRVGLLDPLVVVERLAAVDLPLALGLLLARGALALSDLGGGGCHGVPLLGVRRRVQWDATHPRNTARSIQPWTTWSIASYRRCAGLLGDTNRVNETAHSRILNETARFLRPRC